MKAEAQSSCSKSETEWGTKHGTGNSSSTICLPATLKWKTEAKELAEGLRSWKSDRGLANFSATGAVRCRWPSLSATAAEMNDRMTARANVCLSFQMNDIWLGHCGKIYTLENLWQICKQWILGHWAGVNSESAKPRKHLSYCFRGGAVCLLKMPRKVTEKHGSAKASCYQFLNLQEKVLWEEGPSLCRNTCYPVVLTGSMEVS